LKKFKLVNVGWERKTLLLAADDMKQERKRRGVDPTQPFLRAT
jgi:hypothetical protein